MYYATKDNKDRERTVDLTPEDRLNREIKDDDSNKGSDWCKRTGQPLLRMSKVSDDIRPNRKKAMIYFENDESKYLPVVYAAETHRRTVEQQTRSFIGQTDFRQGRHGNQSTPEHLKKPGNKRK